MTWIDFGELRKQLDFQAVLEHYGATLTIKGNQATCPCPLPQHSGDRSSKSFSANLQKRIFQCFGCGAKGNILDFATLMDGGSPKNSADVRAVAVKLHRRFIENAPVSGQPHKRSDSVAHENRPRQQRQVLVNQPLDFRLKELDPNHAFFKSRGLTIQTVARFGLGFCLKGLMKGRIVVPMYDPRQGKLLGYVGRAITDEEEPRYAFPGRRERDGLTLDFDASLLLYNAEKVARPAYDLIVVAEPESVWWCWQCGFHNTVALLGSACSVEQGRLIADLTDSDGAVWVLTEAGQAGEECAISVFRFVGAKRLVSWVQLPARTSPAGCSKKDLADLLSMI